MTRGARRRRLPLTTLILLFTWVVAGVANYSQFWMGDTPSAFGTAATLVAIIAWPMAGWFMGRRLESGLMRLAAAFWLAVVAGAPVAQWASRTPRTVAQGAGAAIILMTVFVVPLHGLSSIMLPAWEPIAQGMSCGGLVFAMTLLAYYCGRGLGGPAVQVPDG